MPGEGNRQEYIYTEYMYIYIYMCICVYTYTYIYTHNRILLSHKRRMTIPFEATWKDLEIVIVSEISQRQISYDIINMKNLKL